MTPPFPKNSAAVRSCARRQLAAFALLLTVLPGAVVAGPGPAPSAAQAGALTFLVREWTVELPNGDAADVYAPQVPARWQRWFADAFPLVALLQGALIDKAQYRQFSRLPRPRASWSWCPITFAVSQASRCRCASVRSKW